MAAGPEGVSAPKVKIGSEDVKPEALASAVVEQDIDQPDMCSVTVNNTNEYKFSEKVKLGDVVELKISGSANPLFVGEVAGLEPIFDVGGESKIVVRAFNKLHRLTRTRKSKTFMEQSDADIVRTIAGEYGLSAKVSGSVNFKHKHVYQHDLTDLEFLHQRARRIDYEILVKDNRDLVFRQRDLATDSGVKLKWGKDAESTAGSGQLALQAFKPRLNSSNQVKEVTVRGWNSLKSEVIVGEAKSLKTKLGPSDGAAKSESAFGVAKAAYEMAVYSKEEADAAAKSLLEDHALSYIVGEGQCKGDPTIIAGIVVTIDAQDSRFDGKYYLTGTSHRYTHKAGGPLGGYLTFIRFRRNAEGR